MFLVRVQLFVTTFDLVLPLASTGSYVSQYRDSPDRYTRSVLVLSLAPSSYALTSDPYAPPPFGFPPRPDLRPFAFLPDPFVGLAIVVVYRSQR